MKKYTGLWIAAAIILCIGISLTVAGVTSGATQIIKNSDGIFDRIGNLMESNIHKYKQSPENIDIGSNTQEIQRVELDLDGYNVILVPTNKDASVNDSTGITVSTENGVMTVKGVYAENKLTAPTVKIYIPTVELSANIKNSTLSAERIDLASLNIIATNTVISIEESLIGTAFDINTDNGAVSLENVKCKTGDINVTSTSGIISVEETSAPGIGIVSDTGRVEFSSLRTDSIEVYTGSGSIEGDLEGRRSDYTVNITKGGSLTTNGNGAKTVNIFTDSGRVNVEYDD